MRSAPLAIMDARRAACVLTLLALSTGCGAAGPSDAAATLEVIDSFPAAGETVPVELTDQLTLVFAGDLADADIVAGLEVELEMLDVDLVGAQPPAPLALLEVDALTSSASFQLGAAVEPSTLYRVRAYLEGRGLIWSGVFLTE